MRSSSTIIVLFGDPPPMRRGPSGFLISFLLHVFACVLLFFALRQPYKTDSRSLTQRFAVRVMELRKQEPKIHPPIQKANLRPDQLPETNPAPGGKSVGSTRTAHSAQLHIAETGPPDPDSAGRCDQSNNPSGPTSPTLRMEFTGHSSPKNNPANTANDNRNRSTAFPKSAEPGNESCRCSNLVNRIRCEDPNAQPEQDLSSRCAGGSTGADAGDSLKGLREGLTRKRDLRLHCPIAGRNCDPAHDQRGCAGTLYGFAGGRAA